MNVYVRELVSALAQAGVRADVYVRRWRDDLPEVVEVEPGFRVVHVDGRAARPGQGEAARGRRRVHRRGRRQHLRAARDDATPSTPTTGCRAWPATGSSTSCRCRWCRPSTPWPGSRPRPAIPSRPAGSRPRPRSSAAPTPSWPPVRAEADQLVELYGAARERIEIVPPGVDHAFFSPGDRRGARQALAPRATIPVLLFVGRIQPLKGVDVAVRALAELSSAPPRRPAGGRGRGQRPGRPGRADPRPPAGRRAGPGRPGALRRPPAPPPAVDLLPRRRRVRRAQPVRVLRAGGPRGGGLRHAGGGRRRGRAWPPWSTTGAPASWSTSRDPGRLRPVRLASCSTIPAPAAAMAAAAARAGRATTRGRPPRPGCAGSTPTSPPGPSSSAGEPDRRPPAGASDGLAGADELDRLEAGIDTLAGRAAGREPGGRRRRPG